jgi:hypothetical protein
MLSTGPLNGPQDAVHGPHGPQDAEHGPRNAKILHDAEYYTAHLQITIDGI